MAGTWDVMAPVPNNEGSGARGLLGDGSIWAVPQLTDRIRLYRYDEATGALGTWSAAIDSPVGSGWSRAEFVDCCAIEGAFLFFNGTNWTSAYDYNAGAWITGLTPCPVLTDSRAVAGIGRSAFAFGGLDSSGVPQEWAFRYDFDVDLDGGDPWSDLPDVPWPASGAGNVGGAWNQYSVCVRDRNVHFLQGLDDGPEHIKGNHRSYHLSYNVDSGLYTVESTSAAAGSDRRGMGCDGDRRFLSVGGRISPGLASKATLSLHHGAAWVDELVEHPQNQGVIQLTILAFKERFWTVGGGFDTNADAESLCRYSAPFELINAHEGWGARSA